MECSLISLIPGSASSLLSTMGFAVLFCRGGLYLCEPRPSILRGFPGCIWVPRNSNPCQGLVLLFRGFHWEYLGVPSQFAGFPFFIHDERAAQPLPRISRTFPQGTRGLEVENLRGAANACGKGTLVNQIWKRKSTCFWNDDDDDDVDDKDGDELNMNNYHGTGGLRWWCWC